MTFLYSHLLSFFFLAYHLTLTFSLPPSHQVFDEFEMEPHQECTYDHIALYDGTTSESGFLGRYCGAKVPHPIVAYSNQMFMVFKSDSSVQRKGFRARHSTGEYGEGKEGCGAGLKVKRTKPNLNPLPTV